MKEGTIILQAEEVKKYFPIKGSFGKAEKQVKAVDGVSFTLYAGETYGLVGETGCGKSTLGRTVLKLLEPTAGKVIYNGTDISGLTEKKMRPYRKEMQIIFQDPFTSLNPRKQVGQILEEALEIQGIKGDREQPGMEIMEKVGLRKEHYFRYPHEFSGGQRQRIGIARALILEPKVIVCDEPVSALDVSIQSQIINLLLDLQEEKNLAYIFIAHDMSVVKYISTRIGVMYLGHIVEEAVTDDLFGMPLHPYTQALLSAVPQVNPHVRKQKTALKGDVPSPIDPPSGCVFHTRCPYVMPVCKKQAPSRKEKMSGHFVSCHLYENES
ncbi:dipeptide ABC transporter ATP-binding protein [Lachnospiraceae bacterium 54-53]